jgi:hypothetical protein
MTGADAQPAPALAPIWGFPCAESREAFASAAVLGGVGQQFGGAEVGDRLDRRRGPDRNVSRPLHRDGAAGGQGGQRVGQAGVEQRRVDALGQVTQFDESILGAAMGCVDRPVPARSPTTPRTGGVSAMTTGWTDGSRPGGDRPGAGAGRR